MCDNDSELSLSMKESTENIHDYPSGSTVIKISIPSVNLEVGPKSPVTAEFHQKVYSFLSSDLISDVKIAIITDLRLEFRDILNYGLFLPPASGKAGKFLQEDRQIKDYPFSNSVGHLEVCAVCILVSLV